MPSSKRPTPNQPERPRTILSLVGTVIDAVIDGRLDWARTARLVIIVVVTIATLATVPLVSHLWLAR